jgi:tRNA dimethylallyltransferase
LDEGVSPAAKPFESLGYKQAVRFLTVAGTSEAEALEEVKIRTRQYAKRQWTWFRAEKDIVWVPGFGSETETQHKAIEIVSGFLKKSSE